MIFDHMGDKTAFKDVAGELTVSLVSSAVNLKVLFKLEIEVLPVFVEEVPVFSWKTNGFRESFEFFWYC